MNFSENNDDNLTFNTQEKNYEKCMSDNISTNIIKLIEEKNKLIEEYQLTIKTQEKKFNDKIEELLKNLNESNQETESLKNKIKIINNNNYLGLIEYYEKEIGKIILIYDKIIIQYKNNISILLSKEYNKKNNEKLIKIIEVLMKENKELKNNNENQQKIIRKSEMYQLYINSFNDKKIKDFKNYDNFQKNQINKFDLLVLENEKLKEQIEEDNIIISNMKNKYDNYNRINKEEMQIINNRIYNLKNQRINKLNHSCSNPDITKRNIFSFDNNIGYDFDIFNLDKHINSCKILIDEKTNLIYILINKIIEKLEKENSIYKKINLKNLTEINNTLNIIYSEINILIKKSNHSFNSLKISKQILNDILIEYNTNVKNKDINYLSNEKIDYLKKFLNNI